ncbi:hypothetical protein LguiA_016597 [Lonicera macranthoides]
MDLMPTILSKLDQEHRYHYNRHNVHIHSSAGDDKPGIISANTNKNNETLNSL